MNDQALREYRLLAPVYDRLWRRYVRASIEKTLADIPLDGAESVLDVGCGTGALLATLAERYPDLDLHGLDQSPEMLARADQRLRGRARLVAAGAAQLPHVDQSFDLLVSTSALHYLPLPHDPVLTEWRRVLRPGGRIALTDWNLDHRGTRLRVALLRRFGRRRIFVRTHAEIGQLLTDTGLRLTEHHRFEVGGWGLTSAVAVADE